MVLVVGLRPGDFVVLGSPIANVFPPGQPAERLEAIARDVRDCVVTGRERTEEQEAAFGLRQLVDIAVKAISRASTTP